MAAKPVPRLPRILDRLQSHYGEQAPHWPTDPYRFLVWWHSGYPPSEERCSRGFEALQREVGDAPGALLAVGAARLTRVLAAGGAVPALRAKRLRLIATRIDGEFAGDLRAALGRLTRDEARKVLRSLPGIGVPGADRILLFAGLAPVAAVPSPSPHVVVRIQSGREPASYAACYAQAQRLLETQVPEVPRERTRAYLLLMQHGRMLCKRTRPLCSACLLAPECAYLGGAR